MAQRVHTTLDRAKQKAWSRANQQAEKESAILREEMKSKKGNKK